MTRNLENLESFKMLKCEEKEEKNIGILERSWAGVCKIKIQMSKIGKNSSSEIKNHANMFIQEGHRTNFHF